MIYLNGKFMPVEQAMIPVLDRGFIFGDGVYEVIPVYSRQPFRLDGHLQRLAAEDQRSRAILEQMKIDEETIGNGWIEIVRNRGGQVTQLGVDEGHELVGGGGVPRAHALEEQGDGRRIGGLLGVWSQERELGGTGL